MSNDAQAYFEATEMLLHYTIQAERLIRLVNSAPSSRTVRAMVTAYETYGPKYDDLKQTTIQVCNALHNALENMREAAERAIEDVRVAIAVYQAADPEAARQAEPEVYGISLPGMA